MSEIPLDSLAEILSQSVNHSEARKAEQQLRTLESQPGFSISLLHVVANTTFPLSTRLAGALFFKNLIRRKWTDVDGNYKLPEKDVLAIKSEIVGLMTNLPNSLQIQIGEAISTIADSDFPAAWDNLITELVARLGNDDAVNGGVLTVAHSIFGRWRPLFRSDELFSEIQLVLNQFTAPYLEFMLKIDQDIQAAQNNPKTLSQLFSNFNLLVSIYFDLNCQDIPEFFEDNIDKFMTIFHRYLIYTNPLLETDDDTEVGILDTVKASICDVLELYTHRYEDVFEKLLPNFVETTWNLLTTTGLEPKHDILVSKSLSFLTSVAKIDRHAQMFGSEQTLNQIVQNVIIPNMTLRESDEELFEDDPIEYTRRDLEGSDSDTRRRAATDFLRELTNKFEGSSTHVVMSYINDFLSKYESNKHDNWKMKDTAIYLFTSIAAKGNLTHAGVSSTNLLINVIDFFVQHVYPDMLVDNINPILKVDSIKYIHTFRNQLSRDQLASTFPLLSKHLGSSDYVVYTYAAITIEKLLSIKRDNAFLFNKHDIESFSQGLVVNLMSLIVRQNTSPEKLAENEFLMQCVMRVLITSQDLVSPYASTILAELVQIVAAISKNPSNPRFTHFTFESIGAIIRFTGPTVGVENLESVTVPVFVEVLGADVPEFIPYVIQILAQLLQSKSLDQGLGSYETLVRPLMSPALWEAKGNAPALVKMLLAILSHGPSYIVENDLVLPLLGVFQNLIASKVNGNFGVDLLEEIFLYLPLNAIQPHLVQIASLLLQRLQVARTDRFVSRLALFVYSCAAEEHSGFLGPTFAVDFFDNVQEGVFGPIFEQFILPAANTVAGALERKATAVGLTKLLLHNQKFVNGRYTDKWATSMAVLIKLLKSPLPEATHDPMSIVHIDEDVTFGASFAQLSTSSTKKHDPAPSVKDAKAYFSEETKKVISQGNGAVYTLILSLNDELKQFIS